VSQPAGRARAPLPSPVTPPPPEQLAAVRRRVRSARPRPPVPPAAERPVARVVLDLPLAHLDRPFDYLVPADLSPAAVPGARVRVRFAGQLLGGFLLERVERSEHDGRLVALARVVSPEPVLTPEVAALARAVADRYAGTLADVLRLAVPARHARVEAEAAPVATTPPQEPPTAGPWADYADGPTFLDALSAGRAPRGVWQALPGPQWPDALARAVAATVAGGRGALVVVPDARDLARVSAALTPHLPAGVAVALSAELGPAERYRRWLAVRRGSARVVVGTRAAMFAPVAELGLVAVWDDGDDLHAEPRAPYPHVREVLTLRAHLAGAACLVGGFARTAEGAQLLASGWARPLVARRDQLRRGAPLIRAAGEDADLAKDEAARSARLPTLAWSTARDGLASGPVLIQVPRRGYLPALSCDRCREPARCSTCAGPLALASRHATAECRWCGRPSGGWQCPYCGGSRLRAATVGARRTAEELGRAFPGVPVRTSGAGTVLDAVGPAPALVVATPGAEPLADGGYAAALLLDGWALLARPDLRAGEEALRRWLGAAALVRPGAEGGRVVVMADAALRPVQALLRWDPGGFADRELAEREQLGLPPAARLAALTGSAPDVADLLDLASLPATTGVLGPVPTPPSTLAGEPAVRTLLRVPRGDGASLGAALHAAAAVRSARKAGGPVRVQVDPLEVG